MVMGFKNSRQILQRVMNEIFGDLGGGGVDVYMEDIVVYGVDGQEHGRLEKNRMG